MEENKDTVKKKESIKEETYSKKEVEKMIADAVAAAISDKQLTEIFSLLCSEHQKMVAGKIMNAYFENHDSRITPERVKILYSISKKNKKEGERKKWKKIRVFKVMKKKKTLSITRMNKV